MDEGSINGMPFSLAYFCAYVPSLPHIVMFSQYEKAESPIEVTLSGIVMIINPKHSENAQLSIVVTPSERVTLVKT